MSREFEFRSQSGTQKFVLYGVRGLILGMVLAALYALYRTAADDIGVMLNSAGICFISIWMYANVLQARTEIQELFVPPFNLKNGLECLVIGGALMTLSWFF